MDDDAWNIVIIDDDIIIDDNAWRIVIMDDDIIMDDADGALPCRQETFAKTRNPGNCEVQS